MNIFRLAECDRESASNTAMAGYSLTGSVASSYLGQHRYFLVTMLDYIFIYHISMTFIYLSFLLSIY